MYSYEDRLKAVQLYIQYDKSYASVFRELGQMMSVYQYSLVTDMLKKATDNLARNNELARKELDELMGVKVLEFKNEKLLTWISR